MTLLIPDRSWGILTVWMEARGEPQIGRIAVAEVIQRRTRQRFMSDGTVASTCLHPYQFSGWNSKDPNRIKAAKLDQEDPVVKECIRAWETAAKGTNYSCDALHYYNPSVCDPEWAKGMVMVAKVGNHAFMKEV